MSQNTPQSCVRSGNANVVAESSGYAHTPLWTQFSSAYATSSGTRSVMLWPARRSGTGG